MMGGGAEEEEDSASGDNPPPDQDPPQEDSPPSEAQYFRYFSPAKVQDHLKQMGELAETLDIIILSLDIDGTARVPQGAQSLPEQFFSNRTLFWI